MKRPIVTTCLSLLVALLIPSLSMAQEYITLMLGEDATNEWIHLTITANGPWTIEGVKEEAVQTNAKNYYTPTSREITIRGEITDLDCSEDQLVGLDLTHAKSLKKLWCFKNKIKTLDVSTHPDLLWLNCYENSLQTLTLGGNDRLQRLYCYENELTALDLSKAKNLRKVSCAKNQISAIDISMLSQLNDFSCANNKIQTLDLSKSTALSSLWCNGNEISSLDLTNLSGLSVLDCSDNQITTLDLSYTPELLLLWCAGNQLESLQPALTPKVTNLDCSRNKLATLDLSSNTALWVLKCSGNKLRTLDLSQHMKLTDIFAEDNELTQLTVSPSATKLSKVNCYHNNLQGTALADLLTALPTHASQANAAITVIDTQSPQERNEHLSKEQIADLQAKGWRPLDYNNDNPIDLVPQAEPYMTLHTALSIGDPITIQAISNNGVAPRIEGLTVDTQGKTFVASQKITIRGDLASLSAPAIKMTAIDLSRQPNLKTLSLASNQLTKIDLSHNSKLKSLDLSGNQLRSIICGVHLDLTELNLADNLLANVDLSTLFTLRELTLSGNPITTINLEENRALETLLCARTNLTSIDLSHNTKLQVLDLSANALQALSLQGLKDLKEVRIYQNNIALDAMKQLLTDLPIRPQEGCIIDVGLITVIDSESTREKNQFADDFLEIIRPKYWQALDFKGGVNDGRGEVILSNEHIGARELVTIELVEGQVQVAGTTPHTLIRLVSISGEEIIATTSASDGMATIATASLERGSYILLVGDACYKLYLSMSL